MKTEVKIKIKDIFDVEENKSILNWLEDNLISYKIITGVADVEYAKCCMSRKECRRFIKKFFKNVNAITVY